LPNGKFNLTVGKSSPFPNDGRESALGRLADYLAGFATSRIKWHGQHSLILLAIVGQITRAHVHVGTPTFVKPTNANT
jgi:hypothetical protein